jgi:hypothetical protein
MECKATPQGILQFKISSAQNRGATLKISSETTLQQQQQQHLMMIMMITLQQQHLMMIMMIRNHEHFHSAPLVSSYFLFLCLNILLSTLASKTFDVLLLLLLLL